MGKARLRAGILGVAIGLTAGTMAIADPDTKGVQIEVAYTHDSNIARVRKEGQPAFGQCPQRRDLSKQFIRQPSDHTEVLAAIVGGGERFQDFDGLSNAFIGLPRLTACIARPARCPYRPIGPSCTHTSQLPFGHP